ncbi:MAG: LacI family DNA-binding transcriptional regulator [Terriglobales bacterium]|jgi:LacI family transcriptional regulator
MITIRELATASGFSPTTISLVLNSSPAGRHIPEKTKERIRELAHKLGYHPNQFARSLRSSRSHAVAVMVPDISDPYCAQILLGIDKSLYRSTYLPVLIDIQNSRARFRKHVATLLERRIEGVIAVANSLQLQTEMLDVFAKSRIPVIVIGRESNPEWISSVSVDNEMGARIAIEHLYEIGHRRIAFIRGPKRVVDSVRRWQGICDFANGVSLRLDSKLIVQLEAAASSSEAGFDAMNKLLRQEGRFTAVMAFDDMTAFGAIRALTQAGLKVPDQCSVVGFDDVAAAAYYNPPITTVSQSMEELGNLGVSSFLHATQAPLDNNGVGPQPVQHKVKPVLIIRGSTAAV